MVDDPHVIPDPLFDDEDLPAWLKEGGVTFLGRVAAHETGPLVDFEKAPWELAPPDDSPIAESADLPPWMAPSELDSPFEAIDEDAASVDVPVWMKVQTGELRSTPPPAPAAPVQPPVARTAPAAKMPKTVAPEPDDDLRGFYGDPDLIPDVADDYSAVSDAPLDDDLRDGSSGEFSDAEMRLDFLDALPEFQAEPPQPTADMPEWMRQAGTGLDPTVDADADLLQALAQTSGPPSAKISRTVTEIDNPEAPDWLRGLASTASERPGLQPTDGDMDWLSDLGEAEPVSITHAPDVKPPAASPELPDWLRGLDPTNADAPGRSPSAAAPTRAPTGKGPAVPEPASETPAQPLPAAFPATGISPEKLAGPKKEESLSSADIDALLNLAPVSVDLPEPAIIEPPSGLDMPWDSEAADRNALSSLEDDWSLPPSDSSSLLTADQRFTAPSMPTASNDLEALGEVSFEDTTLDEMLGPPSAALRVGPQAYTLPPDEIPPAPDSASLGPSLINRPGGLRKLPKRSDELAIPLPDAATISGELPEFVQEMRPADAPVELNIGGVQVGVKEEPLSKLSESLRQLRDRAREALPEPDPASPEAMPAGQSNEGALAEIAGVIAPVQLKIEAPAQTPSQAIASDLQLKRVQLMQSLLEIDESTGVAAAQIKRRARRRFGLDRMFIAVLLFAVIALPFFNSSLNIMIAPDASTTTPSQKSAFTALDGIGRAQPVIMAFEYGSSGAGELDDLARVLLRELFAHGAKPIIVSTNAIGALHAQALLTMFGRDQGELQRLNRVGQPLTARVDYVLLRYLPAGAAGVRSLLNAVYIPGFETDTQFLTSDLEGKPTGLTPADVIAAQRAPVIVLGESAEDIRNWAEQYRPTSGQKVLFAVSVAADATARSYAASSPTLIVGPLVGLRDAILFPALRGQSVSAADAALSAERWQSTGLGALVAGIIILLGSTASIIGTLRKRGRSSQEAAR